MSDKPINDLPLESTSIPKGEGIGQTSDNEAEQTPPPSDLDDDREPQDAKEGFTFNWLNLVIGVAIFLWLSKGGDIFSDDWGVYPYLAIVVVIHELGHLIMGRSFGCHIKEMQVFFLPFVSYKPEQTKEASPWRDIKWSLGVLPLGGVTVFKSRKTDVGHDAQNFGVDSVGMDVPPVASPYIEDKPAWQRMLISAAGVLFNIATFLILYYVLPFLSYGGYDIFRPLAVMSLFIAILNILPVYPLDGGAIVFALYEMVSGKKPSQGFTNACAWIGFIFIILFFWVFPDWLSSIISDILGMFFN